MDQATTRVLADRYVLQAPLGEGGAGTVWRAHDEVLDRTVAVKLLHPGLAGDDETTARFRAEAAAAAKLTHPHAVVVYDIGEEDGEGYLVMELVDGGTLADALEEGPLPPGVTAALGMQVGRALGSAHARGLVHRDVKPANVLITTDGLAKVADFGIARALGDATARLTSPGQVVGTARYLAPEQLDDDRVDARTDVYALGLVLHQAVTGVPPFGEGTAVEVAARRLVEDGLPRVSALRPEVPAALDQVLARATALDPEQRYADGGQLAEALAPLAAPYATTELAARVTLHRLRRDHRPGGSDGAALEHTPPTARPDPAPARTTRLAPVSPATATPSVPERDPAATATLTTTTTTATAGAAPRGPDATQRHRPHRWVAGLAAVLVVGALIVGTGGDDERTATPTSGDGSTTTGSGEPYTVADVADHDPLGDDRRENPDAVDQLIDGDPATSWTTQGYNTADLGGLKPGVGFWVDLGESRPLGEVVVSTAAPGAQVQVHVADSTPAADEPPEDWGELVGSAALDDERSRIPLAEGTQGRIVLLWFTELPADGGRHRATIGEFEVRAP